MKHSMKLNRQAFELVLYGTKRVEIRLLDDKRKSLRVGDIIEFTMDAPDAVGSIAARIVELRGFETFFELVRSYARIDLGLGAEVTDEQILDQIYKIYPREKELQLGVLGIRFEL